MRRQSKRPRFNISSLYTGAGSKQEVFNRTSTKPFAKLKRNYGNFLERFRPEEKQDEESVKQLTDEERQHIRSKMSLQNRKDQKKKLIVLFGAIVLTILLFKLLSIAINSVYFKNFKEFFLN